MRRRSTDYIVKYVHAEDLQTSHIDIGPVNKVINMCVCFHADGANSGTAGRMEWKNNESLTVVE